MEDVWIFNGGENPFPSAVFSGRSVAEEWIRERGLSGTLTRYPVNVSVYDWVAGMGDFQPKKEYQSGPRFIQNFSSAYLEHYHYDRGERPDEEDSDKGQDEQSA